MLLKARLKSLVADLVCVQLPFKAHFSSGAKGTLETAAYLRRHTRSLAALVAPPPPHSEKRLTSSPRTLTRPAAQRPTTNIHPLMHSLIHMEVPDVMHDLIKTTVGSRLNLKLRNG